MTEWEPREALLAGADGLDSLRAAISSLRPPCGRTSPRYAEETATATAAAVGLEVGRGQAGTVAGLLAEAGFRRVEIRTDLAGIERVVVGRA